eukprot:8184180-Alexandrium_andersonii.AAC.1
MKVGQGQRSAPCCSGRSVICPRLVRASPLLRWSCLGPQAPATGAHILEACSRSTARRPLRLRLRRRHL